GIISFAAEDEKLGISADVALQWTGAYTETLRTFANTITTTEGGAHEDRSPRGARIRPQTVVPRWQCHRYPGLCFSSRCVIADVAKLFHVCRNTLRYRSERFAILSSFPAGCRSSRAHLDASRRRILRRPSAVRSSTRSSLNGFALCRGLTICVQTWDLKPLALASASDEPGILSTSIGAEAFKEDIWLTRTR
ncbi:MAG: hypothetical protein J6S33_04485, partial [Aeriscardovia sp.]|nr:hypothetical protein [Aeriscardovia sp.]